MTENTPKIIYPEMLEYASVKDLDRVTAASKCVKPDHNPPPVTVDKLPKNPVKLVLTTITESIAYPEIVKAWTKGERQTAVGNRWLSAKKSEREAGQAALISKNAL